MRLIKKVVKVGGDSLMVILDKDVCKKLKISFGDYVELEIKRVEV